MSDETDPPLGNRRLVDGRRLWLDLAGSGDPAVAFVPGAGGFGMDFLRVHQLVASTTTSIIYDRAGTGWSDDTRLPRTLDEVTNELHTVLEWVGVDPPHVLVGHSLGGLYVRRFAQRFPDQVAAMLLLDPAHEDWDLYMPDPLKMANQPVMTEMPELPAEFIAQYRGAFTALFTAFPDTVRDLLVDRHFQPDRLPNGFREAANVLALFDEVRHGGPEADVPVIILSGTGTDATQTLLSDGDLVRQQIDGSHQLYDAIAARTPGWEHRVLDDASHLSLPLARPDAVHQAINDLLERK